MNKAKHYCDNINCNHNDTKGLCCLFNPENCKYRQLQKENAELKGLLQRKEMLLTSAEITAHNEGADKIALLKENKELKKELKKWKDEWQEQVQKENDESYARTLQTMQLTKAKEIIRELFHYIPSWTGEGNDKPRVYAMPNKLRAKAEQFIKDSEV